jgi:hypothetical protein
MRRRRAAIDPTTRAEVGPAVVVAGRTAYELVLTPKDSTTLVAQVRLAVDGERHLPLRVQVFSTKQSTPAIEVGFTSIDFSAPEARQFEFTPPPGTTVTEGMPEGLGDKALGDKAAGMPTEPGAGAAAAKAAAPRAVGTRSESSWPRCRYHGRSAGRGTAADGLGQLQSLLAACSWGQAGPEGSVLARLANDGVAPGARRPAARGRRRRGCW